MRSEEERKRHPCISPLKLWNNPLRAKHNLKHLFLSFSHTFKNFPWKKPSETPRVAKTIFPQEIFFFFKRKISRNIFPLLHTEEEKILEGRARKTTSRETFLMCGVDSCLPICRDWRYNVCWPPKLSSMSGVAMNFTNFHRILFVLYKKSILRTCGLNYEFFFVKVNILDKKYWKRGLKEA